MKEKTKSILSRTKNHVKRQKFAYAWGAVALAAVSLQQTNRKAFYAFLEEKGIDPTEYFCPEYLEEQKNK